MRQSPGFPDSPAQRPCWALTSLLAAALWPDLKAPHSAEAARPQNGGKEQIPGC